jgi:predicted dehydrogenase
MIRVGLIGYGYASRTFHAPLIEAAPGLELAAVASSDAAKVHADRPGVRVHADPGELIARADLDLVVIPTPNDTHHPLARAALQAGRHVVVDKPFTVTLAQGEELVRLARERGRVLSVFHNRRWDGDFLTLGHLLREGRLGRVVEATFSFDRFRPEVRARWREGRDAGSGLWYDLGPHLLDQALRLFGWPEAIVLDRAVLRDGAAADDWFCARLRYERLRVTLHAGTLVAAPAPRFAVHGTHGSFVKEGLDAQEDALKAGVRPAATAAGDWGRDPGHARLLLRGEAGALEEAPVTLARGDYPRYYAELAAALRGEGPVPVPAEEALDVIALVEAGIASDLQRREARVPPRPSQGQAASATPG